MSTRGDIGIYCCIERAQRSALPNIAVHPGIILMAQGNSRLYRRDGVGFAPVTDLAPAQLALGWRLAELDILCRELGPRLRAAL